MNRILAALAPDPYATAVLAASIDLSVSLDAKLSLLRVVEGAGEVATSNATLVAEARMALHEYAREVPVEGLEYVRGATGIPWQEIDRAAEDLEVDLVVVGARRYGALERALGTTATRVVDRARCSVLVVRGWSTSPKRVLVGMEPPSPDALALAVRLGARGAKLRLLKAPGDRARVPESMLDGVRLNDRASGWSEICNAALEYDADLILMGARSPSLGDAFFRSPAAKVVDSARGSVLVVKPPSEIQGAYVPVRA